MKVSSSFVFSLRFPGISPVVPGFDSDPLPKVGRHLIGVCVEMAKPTLNSYLERDISVV